MLINCEHLLNKIKRIVCHVDKTVLCYYQRDLTMSGTLNAESYWAFIFLSCLQVQYLSDVLVALSELWPWKFLISNKYLRMFICVRSKGVKGKYLVTSLFCFTCLERTISQSVWLTSAVESTIVTKDMAPFTSSARVYRRWSAMTTRNSL
jgi:hypothetical protein